MTFLLSCLVSTCLPQAGDSLGDGGSVLDFMSMKSYSDASLDISALGSLGTSRWACSRRRAGGSAPCSRPWCYPGLQGGPRGHGADVLASRSLAAVLGAPRLPPDRSSAVSAVLARTPWSALGLVGQPVCSVEPSVPVRASLECS